MPAADAAQSAGPEIAAEPAGRLALSWLANRYRSGLWLLGFLLLGAVLFAAYLMQARSLPALSSSACQALQAWAMWHGNILLRGWTLSDVSYWSTELPEYALVEMARGLNSDTVHVAAALTYTLVLVLGAVLAKGRSTGREALVRGAIAVTIMLAPPLTFGTRWLLAGPDHLGTQAPLFLIWLVLDRARARWWVPIATTLLFSWVLIGDALSVYEGVLPLLAVCAVRLYRRREPRARRWYELGLVASAGAGLLISHSVLDAIHSAGGFLVTAPSAAFTSATALPATLWYKTVLMLEMFGANFLGLPLRLIAFFTLVHFACLIGVIVAVATALRRFNRDSDLVTQVLVVGFVTVLVAYLLANKDDANEIVAAVPVGAVLAGRVLGARMLRAGLVPAFAVLVACIVAGFGHNLSQVRRPAPPSTNQVAARWLKAHHLDYGLAGYWDAGSITVDSGGAVRVRPVRMYAGRLVTTPSESDLRWYDAGRHDARYVLLAPPHSCRNVCLSGHDVLAQFGGPQQAYRLGNWTVWVYDHNLLARLPVLYWCQNWAWSWTSVSRPSARQCPAGTLF